MRPFRIFGVAVTALNKWVAARGRSLPIPQSPPVSFARRDLPAGACLPRRGASFVIRGVYQRSPRTPGHSLLGVVFFLPPKTVTPIARH